MEKSIKIAITGPESTGKTTLGIQLAEHFGGLYVQEMARIYLENKNTYDVTDIFEMAKLQLQEEQVAQQKAKPGQLIFCDTEMINFKLWLEDKNFPVPEFISKAIANREYGMYLLTTPDLTWEPDPLRENEHRREYFFQLFEKELKEVSASYFVIDGLGETRKEKAIKLINKFYF